MAVTDARVNIKIAPNKMRAFADYYPPTEGGSALTADDVKHALDSMNVSFGIIQDALERIAQSDRPISNMLVAEGIAPKTGENARLETLIDIRSSGRAKQRDDGSVDFHDLGDICSAEADQPLYRKIPPATGQSGCDVTGIDIPGIMGRDIKLLTGRGTKIDNLDPNLVRAAVEGEVLVKKGILEISEVHSVNGDVDFSTGNIRFKGSVRINGSVKAGFQVIGDGAVEVKGNVEDAVIIGGHDVVIHGGFVGSGQGSVKAKQDVYVKFIENQHIEAERDIIINGEAYHANLQAGRSILAKGPKSLIVGGKCEAKFSVEALTFGSVACTPTSIKIGTDPKLTEKMAAVDAEIIKTEESLKKLEQSIVFLYRQKIDNKNVLPPEKASLLEKLEQAKASLPEILETLRKEQSALKQTKDDMEKAYAVAGKNVFPKVQVHVGNQWLTVEDTLGPSRFRLVESEIVRLSM
jgi:uncharacterized protein